MNMGQTEKNEPTDADADDQTDATAREPHDHHAGLWSALVQHTDAVTASVASGHGNMQARSGLVRFLHNDVLAHLSAEERVLYQAVREIGADELVAALELDHRRLLDLVEQLEQTEDPLEAALLSRAFIVLFALRVEKEDTIILPALKAAGVDVAPVLDRMIVQMATEHGSHFTYF